MNRQNAWVVFLDLSWIQQLLHANHAHYFTIIALSVLKVNVLNAVYLFIWTLHQGTLVKLVFLQYQAVCNAQTLQHVYNALQAIIQQDQQVCLHVMLVQQAVKNVFLEAIVQNVFQHFIWMVYYVHLVNPIAFNAQMAWLADHVLLGFIWTPQLANHVHLLWIIVCHVWM